MNVSDDHFDAAPTGDGVLVRMSDNVAEVLGHRIGLLARFLETGEVDTPPGGLFRRKTTPEDVVRRMFPDVYADRAEADAFRARHTAVLGDSGPARRFVARCAAGSEHVLPRAEVEEWLGVLSQVRFLTLDRDRAPKPHPDLVWFDWALSALLLALHPDWLRPR
ncbi:DUF2017 family protein [Actinokineospora soli]|uniref:DUF2017 family protein n=1 Tax=Actinokineospora soli TaxID=1048753 RepID=A0ABW2TLR7_9PSEU